MNSEVEKRVMTLIDEELEKLDRDPELRAFKVYFMKLLVISLLKISSQQLNP